MKTKLTFLAGLTLLQALLLGEEGKIYIKTEPTGAEIIINEKTLGKTNTLLELPIGKQEITLRLPNHEDKTITIDIHNKHIIKPDTIKMTPTTCKIDFLIEEGWQIYVNNARTTDIEGKPAETPCSIYTTPSNKITLAKDGFLDLEFKAAPNLTVTDIGKTKGISKQQEKEKAERKLLIGKWKVIKKNYNSTWDFHDDNTITNENNSGTWNKEKDKIYIKWHGGKWWDSFFLPLNNKVNGQSWDSKLTATKLK